MLINSNLPAQSKAAHFQSPPASLKPEARAKALPTNPATAQNAAEATLSRSLDSNLSVMDRPQADESTRLARHNIFSRFDDATFAHGNFNARALLSLLD